MASIFQRALGADFDRLHPRLQRRFSVDADVGIAQLGRGTMTDMHRGVLPAVPVALFGRSRRTQLPGSADDVPFKLANYSYRDGFGRPTFAYARRFHIAGRTHRFDDTMIFSERRGCIVNYLGSHQDIAAELRLHVTNDGRLRMISGEQRAYLGPLGFRLPHALAARAEVIESWDEQAQRFTISVEVDSPAGRLFAYHGWFVVAPRALARSDIPADALPDRERQQD